MFEYDRSAMPEDGDLFGTGREPDLGPRVRTYRPRVRLPFLLVGVWGGVLLSFLFSAFVTNDHDLSYWKVFLYFALAAVPLGALLGTLLAPASEDDEGVEVSSGQVRLDLHERGVRLRRKGEDPVVCVPAALAWPEGRDRAAPSTPLYLVWPRGDDSSSGWVALTYFGSSDTLRRALLWGETTRAPVLRRSAVVLGYVALLGMLYVPTLMPEPPPGVPRDETDIRWFCGEQERTFADAPPYEGEGPHGLGYEVLRGMETEEQVEPGLEPYLRERGLPTDMANASLIACGSAEYEDEDEVFDTCVRSETGPDGPVPRGDHLTTEFHAMRYTFELYAAATHRHVATVSATGVPVGGNCEGSRRFRGKSGDETRSEAAYQDLEPLMEELAPYMEGPPEQE